MRHPTHIPAPTRTYRPQPATPTTEAPALVLLPALLAGLTVGLLDVLARVALGIDTGALALAWLWGAL
jgi:hypothetical protein